MSNYEIIPEINALIDDTMNNETKKEFIFEKIKELLSDNLIESDELNVIIQNSKSEYDKDMEKLVELCNDIEHDLECFMCEISKGNYDTFNFDSDVFDYFIEKIDDTQEFAEYIIDTMETIIENYNDVYDCMIDDDVTAEMVDVIVSISECNISKNYREKCDDIIRIYGKKL